MVGFFLTCAIFWLSISYCLVPGHLEYCTSIVRGPTAFVLWYAFFLNYFVAFSMVIIVLYPFVKFGLRLDGRDGHIQGRFSHPLFHSNRVAGVASL